MSHIATEAAPGYSAPVLNAGLLRQVHELNLDYVELLIAEHATRGSAAQLQYLTTRLVATLTSLGAPARRALAATAYSLYSLGFEDEGFWRAACESAAPPIDHRYAAAGAVWLQGPFCEVALLHAWHVAASNPLAARMVYGMPDATAQILNATPLWRMKRIANDYPVLLAPRWSGNAAFWPDLVRFAAARDVQRLAASQLLGNQLIAAELEFAEAQARRGNPRAQRLRARRLRFATPVR